MRDHLVLGNLSSQGTASFSLRAGGYHGQVGQRPEPYLANRGKQDKNMSWWLNPKPRPQGSSAVMRSVWGQSIGHNQDHEHWIYQAEPRSSQAQVKLQSQGSCSQAQLSKTEHYSLGERKCPGQSSDTAPGPWLWVEASGEADWGH